jgi:hypothetical protein
VGLKEDRTPWSSFSIVSSCCGVIRALLVGIEDEALKDALHLLLFILISLMIKDTFN